MDDIRVLSLCDAAHRLGVDPFEVVRLVAIVGLSPPGLRFSEDDVDAITAAAGIERWWPYEPIPEDDSPRRAVVRAAVAQLLERGVVVGHATTRLDNLWRGLPAEHAELVRDAATLLLQDGSLVAHRAAEGLQIAVHPDAVATLDALANGDEGPASLAALW